MAKERIALVDWLKAVCIVFVIVVHGDFLNDAMLDKGGLFYLLAVNKAVPVFMFLSGFVFALSGGRKSVPSLYKGIWRRFLRLTIPTMVAFLAFILLKAFTQGGINTSEIIYRLCYSDYGRGSYYYPVMIQFILLAPCMYAIIRKHAATGVVLMGAINLIYELLCTFFGIRDEVYRIIFVRYLLIIALGMYFSVKRHKKTNWVAVALMWAVGLTYILLPYFTQYEYRLFTISPWNLSGMMSAFYVSAVLLLLYKLFGRLEGKFFLMRFVSKIGQASYHIMYTQLLYFVIRPAFDTLVFDLTILPLWSQYMIDIVVCVASGMVFCAIDNKIFGKLYKSKK